MNNILEYKGLIYELAARDLKIRYRKPFLGFFWMLIMPFSTALIYKILFSDFMNASSAGFPFFIHLITSLLPWSYFATAVQAAPGSVLGSKNIINQISFPKYLMPVSTVFANLINFLPTMIILIVFILAYNIKISLLIVFLPLVILIHTCLIIGLALIGSSLQIIYRDVEYILQIMVMILFFLTPGVYTLEYVINKTSPSLAGIYMLNPFVGMTNLYRIVLVSGYLNSMPTEANFLNTLVIPVLFSIGMLFLGYSVFKKNERRFSDYLNT